MLFEKPSSILSTLQPQFFYLFAVLPVRRFDYLYDRYPEGFPRPPIGFYNEDAGYRLKDAAKCLGRDIATVSSLVSRYSERMGCSLQVWEHRDFTGASRIFHPNIVYVGDAWNDEISSLAPVCR